MALKPRRTVVTYAHSGWLDGQKRKKITMNRTQQSVTKPNNVNGSNNTPAVTAFCYCCCRCFCLPSLRSTRIDPQQQPCIIIITIIVIIIITTSTVTSTTTIRTLLLLFRVNVYLCPRYPPCPVTIRATFRWVSTPNAIKESSPLDDLRTTKQSRHPDWNKPCLMCRN